MTTGNITSSVPTSIVYTFKGKSSRVNTGLKATKVWSGGDTAPNTGKESPFLWSQKFPPIVIPPKPPKYGSDGRRLPKEKASAMWAARNEAFRAVRDQSFRKWVFKYTHPRRRKFVLDREPHSYTMTRERSWYGAYCVWHTTKPNNWYFTNIGRWSTGHIPLNPQEHYAVLEKLRRRAYGTGFHPGIFAAEMPKALSMVREAATQLRLGFLAAVKGNWRGVLRQFGHASPELYGKGRYSWIEYREGRMTLAQFWLAIRYGWEPLVADLQAAAGYIAWALNESGGIHLKKSLSASKKFSHESYLPVTSTGTALTFTRQTTKSTVRYSVVKLKAKAVMVPTLADFWSTVWEVVPYSFVFDWVIPLGGYLESLRTVSDLQGTIVLSILQESTWDRPEIKFGTDYNQYTRLTNFDTNYVEVKMTRTVSEELAPPTPLGDLAPSSIFRNWKRAVSAVALLQKLEIPSGEKRLRTPLPSGGSIPGKPSPGRFVPVTKYRS